MSKVLIVFISIVSLFHFSCKKKTKCAAVNFSGLIYDNSLARNGQYFIVHVPDATVFYRHSVPDPAAPVDTNAFDGKVKSGSDGHFMIQGLEAGQYYFYAVAYNSSGKAVEAGGAPYSLACSDHVTTVSHDFLIKPL